MLMLNKFIFFVFTYCISLSVFSQEKIVKLNQNESLRIYNRSNGVIEKGVYICSKIDWKIKIPENYTVDDLKMLNEIEEKGNFQLKKIDSNLKSQKNTNLIGFSLNNKNSFSASFSELDLDKFILNEHKRKFVENLRLAFGLIENGRFEFEESNIKIGKHQFYKVKVKGYNNNRLALTQIYFNGIIDKLLFSALISYKDDLQGAMLEKNFINSMNE